MTPAAGSGLQNLVDATRRRIRGATVVAIVAGVLGFSGVAGAAANIAWILFVVGLILALIFFIRGRRPTV